MKTFARSIALGSLMAMVTPALSAEAVIRDSLGAAEQRLPTLHTPSLDLEYVLRQVLERNPTVGAARAAWSEAKARARLAGAWEDPMLDLMAAPRTFGSSSVEAAYRIGIQQSFPIFGQRGLRRRMAEADARAAAWDLRTAQLDLVLQARLMFAEYWRNGRAIALNQELLDLLPQFRRLTLAKYSAGLVGQQDPLQVDAQLAMPEHAPLI